MNQADKDLAVVIAAAAGIGVVLFLATRSSAAPPPPPPSPSSPPVTVLHHATPPVEMQIVPLQDPRTPLTNTNDPARDRAVTQVMAAQLDALHAPARTPTLIRATAYLASKGSPAPTLPTQTDVLYWAARKINDDASYTFYGA